MFGALNRFIGLDAEPVQQTRAQNTSDNSFGFQVLRNKDAELPLEPWFDFIVGINGRLIVSGQFNMSRGLGTRAMLTISGGPRPKPLRYRSAQLRGI